MIERKLMKKASFTCLLLSTLVTLYLENAFIKTTIHQDFGTKEKKHSSDTNFSTSDSIIRFKESNKVSPLYFIMHVGPPKTGTTSIQCGLRYLEEKRLLPKNISIMETQACSTLEERREKHLLKIFESGGNFSTTDKKDLLKAHIMTKCLLLWNGHGMPKCWKSGYLPYIKNQERRDKSIIVSKEVASFLITLIRDKELSLEKRYQFWNDFTDSIGPRFHTVILITYRNFFDWIYSYYTEQNKHGNRKQLTIWPNDGGRIIPSIQRYTEKNFEDDDDDLKDLFYTRRHFVNKLEEAFSPSQKNSSTISLKTINMDMNEDVKKCFFCNGLPSSFHMCNLVDKISPQLEKNESPDHLWCDMLATEAHTKGFITSNIERRIASKKIQMFQEKQGISCSDFPKSCPSNDFYDRLFNKSMELHYKVFPDDYNPRSYDKEQPTIESLYREKFEKAKSKFCTLNATAVFENEKWKIFLNDL